ncbi:MAG: phosphatase PAP2 family protein [Candidatus Brocadiia bacterium]
MAELWLVRLVEVVLGAATCAALLLVAFPRERPWRVAARTLKLTVASRRRLLYVAACVAVLAFNCAWLASGLDERCTAWVEQRWGRDDFAGLFYHYLEGGAVARLQAALATPVLTWALGFVYVVVFPCLGIVALLVFDHLRDRQGLAMVLIGYLVDFAILLPFCVVFPVLEVHAFYARHPELEPAARLLLDDITPTVMRAYRGMSGLDNCFPSFHTSLAVTLALLSWRAGRRLFGAVFTSAAAANVFATLYLGIHWVSDVAAGVASGLVAYAAARRLSRPWAQEGDRPETEGE